MHLAFLRWYTGAGPKAHRRVVLAAANQLPVLQHWLQRSLQHWNKLATADPGCWPAHQAFVESMQMWQGGNSSCWATCTTCTGGGAAAGPPVLTFLFFLFNSLQVFPGSSRCLERAVPAGCDPAAPPFRCRSVRF